ncbi:DUF2846 domain-containing protein [Ferrovibrio terrae]|uniref:DUF2846 domain-containing protein n=1 Tax=Ferrovibrio terrae TaxID=2594003 RepID=A0A516GYN7_9PROT|nr:DUF2846 domain-containing protein [Ferrovibrio terrae]QDO96612.1 DUF2846 domain-containing protein [Ferrovibrio terrae]
MMRTLALALTAMLLLAGCAARGPTLAEKPEALPPLAEGKARLFVFRDVQRGGLNVDVLRPEILINDQPLGTSVAGGLHVRDVPPGAHTLKLAPPNLFSGYTVDNGVTVDLKAGDVEYVKVMATRFSMQCFGVGCSSSTSFVIGRAVTVPEREAAMHRALLSVESK